MKALTIKGSLTPEEKTYFRSKLCKTVDRKFHVCCGKKLPKPTTIAPTITEPSEKVSKLPQAPNCGFHLGSNVTESIISNGIILTIFL